MELQLPERTKPGGGSGCLTCSLGFSSGSKLALLESQVWLGGVKWEKPGGAGGAGSAWDR